VVLHHGPVTPPRARWLGLAATVLLAVVAYLAGSYDRHDAAWYTGTVLWYPAGALLIYAWWAVRDVPSTRWLLATGALWALPLLVAPALGSHDVYAYACRASSSRTASTCTAWARRPCRARGCPRCRNCGAAHPRRTVRCGSPWRRCPRGCRAVRWRRPCSASG